MKSQNNTMLSLTGVIWYGQCYIIVNTESLKERADMTYRYFFSFTLLFKNIKFQKRVW